MADIGKVWSFTQLGPPGDSMVLTGWSAPFGRPRNGTLVNAGTAIRTAATYYSGNIPPTVPAFGRARPPWELSGRFMDQATSVGYTQALQKQWNDFVEAQQIVRAQWGEILSYQIFIDKMDLNYESEHEIAWAMKGTVILDEASTATRRMSSSGNASLRAALSSKMTECNNPNSATGLSSTRAPSTISREPPMVRTIIGGRDMMGTRVVRVEYNFVSFCGRLYMEPGTCCDMDECIAFFKKIDPNVIYISTIAGEEGDTSYRLIDGSWQAFEILKD